MRRLLVVVALGLALVGCGSDDDDPTLRSDDPSAAPSASAVACASGGPAAVPEGGDLTKKPEIEIPDLPPPCQLSVADIVEGTGAEAVAGTQIAVKYVGVTYATGKEFDTSWGGQDFTFALGAGSVIGGWDKGLVGMKVGGRRQLVIPPDLAYGDQARGPDIPPGSTLVFVVDLVKVG